MITSSALLPSLPAPMLILSTNRANSVMYINTLPTILKSEEKRGREDRGENSLTALELETPQFVVLVHPQNLSGDCEQLHFWACCMLTFANLRRES